MISLNLQSFREPVCVVMEQYMEIVAIDEIDWNDSSDRKCIYQLNRKPVVSHPVVGGTKTFLRESTPGKGRNMAREPVYIADI